MVSRIARELLVKKIRFHFGLCALFRFIHDWIARVVGRHIRQKISIGLKMDVDGKRFASSIRFLQFFYEASMDYAVFGISHELQFHSILVCA